MYLGQSTAFLWSEALIEISRFYNWTSSCLVQIKVEPVGVQYLDACNGIKLTYSRLKPVQLLDLLGWLSLHSFSHGKYKTGLVYWEQSSKVSSLAVSWSRLLILLRVLTLTNLPEGTVIFTEILKLRYSLVTNWFDSKCQMWPAHGCL